jgi:hypothetical protein
VVLFGQPHAALAWTHLAPVTAVRVSHALSLVQPQSSPEIPHKPLKLRPVVVKKQTQGLPLSSTPQKMLSPTQFLSSTVHTPWLSPWRQNFLRRPPQKAHSPATHASVH